MRFPTNIITGMIVPETNCAPKVARRSASLRSSKVAATSS